MARLWDTRSGAPLAELSGHEHEVLFCAFVDAERVVDPQAGGPAEARLVEQAREREEGYEVKMVNPY